MLQYMDNGVCGHLGVHVAPRVGQVYNIAEETATIRNQRMMGITVLEIAVDMLFAPKEIAHRVEMCSYLIKVNSYIKILI